MKSNHPNVQFYTFEPSLAEKLVHYLTHLSDESRSRFGPHAFTNEAIDQLYNDPENYQLFIAKNTEDDSIIAYTIIKMGWLDFEFSRLKSYGLQNEPGDCTLAPSVADAWQSRGIGTSFMKYLIEYLKNTYQIRRIFLWGGVQSSNTRAVNLYKKFGFRILGQFEYHGLNDDMLLEL